MTTEYISHFSFASPSLSHNNYTASKPENQSSSFVKLAESDEKNPVLRRSLRNAPKIKLKSEVFNDPSLSHKKCKRDDRTSPVKKKRGYASPEAYAHLPYLPDHIKNELDVLFCGINPGRKSATDGHHFAHPTNHFWRCLHLGGFTERQLDPCEDQTLPDAYNLGLTNLIERPSCEQSELSKDEMRAAGPNLLEKIAAYRPRIVCFVGKDIWFHVKKALLSIPSTYSTDEPIIQSCDPETLHRKPQPDALFTFDIQPFRLVYPDVAEDRVKETFFFVMPSSSARVVHYQMQDKAEMFLKLRQRLHQLNEKTLDMTNMRTTTFNRKSEIL